MALPTLTGHPSQRCSEVALGRETRIVSTQEEAMNAVMNASVGCILVANSIRFQPSPWGRDVCPAQHLISLSSAEFMSDLDLIKCLLWV